MQDKTTLLETTSAGTGLKINRKKTELMKMNTTANAPVTFWWRAHQGDGVFRLPGKRGWPTGRHRPRRHTQNLQGKSSFRHAQKYLDIWGNQRENQTPHELIIFNSNVKSVLLYRCETWWATQTMQQKIKTFFNTYPRRIYKIQWKGKIRNEDLWERAGLELL